MDILNIENCTISYQGQKAAVDDVSLSIGEKEIVSIVGESGSGKTTLIRAILGILPPGGKVTDGKILFQGKNILELDERSLQKIRGTEIAMIFQDVGASLDPIRIVDSQYRESILVHRKMPKEECRGLEKKMLTKMHLTDPERVLGSYPFELSGGMKQRVGIAMSMTARPKLLLADEPTSALDVTIQAEVVREMKKLREQYQAAIILVTHNMGVASYISDKIGVMCQGKLVEFGKRDDVIFHPKHEYTKGLLRSIPKLDTRNQRLIPIAGSPVDLTSMPAGCAFASRCDCAMKICLTDLPEELPINEDHRAACWMNVKHVYDEARKEGAAQ